MKTFFMILSLSIFFGFGCSDSGTLKQEQTNKIKDKNITDTNISKTDFFPVGVYYIRGQKPIFDDGLDDEEDFRFNPTVAKNEYFKEFKELKSYGFNTAVITINPLVLNQDDDPIRAKGVINALLDSAEKSSIKVIVPTPHIEQLINQREENLTDIQIEKALDDDFIDIFKTSDSVLGYTIYDEPDSSIDAKQLGMINDAIIKKDPDSFVLSAWNNIKTIQDLNDNIRPNAILIDMYPFAIDDYNADQADTDTPLGDLSDAFPRGKKDDGSFNLGEDQPSFSEWINITSSIASSNQDIWVIFQAFDGDTYWRRPSPKELRLQAFEAIKNGAKGIFYFLYQSEEWINGMLDIKHKPTPLLIEAKEINKKIDALSSTLLKLDKTDKNFVISKLNQAQTFKNNDKKYIIVVNKDVEHKKDISINIDKDWRGNKSRVYDLYSGKYFTINKENNITLNIDIADMQVLLLE